LLATEQIEHSYAHCCRCHNATIFRATDQWFIGMDNNGLREKALDAIKGVKWIPEWGEERISNMVSSRPDWCISRQRVWGVPIVVFYCSACREPLTDRNILDKVVDLFEHHSADVWFERTAAELVPAGTLCGKCGAGEFSKENDILDVWFDSGSRGPVIRQSSLLQHDGERQRLPIRSVQDCHLVQAVNNALGEEALDLCRDECGLGLLAGGRM